MRGPAAAAFAVALALLLLLPVGLFGPEPSLGPWGAGSLARAAPSPTGARGPAGPWAHAAAPDLGPRLLPPGERVNPANGSVRNVLVVSPCDAYSNAEVEQAYDPTLGYLYEAWIGCGGIGFSRSVDGGYSFGPAFAVPGSTPANGSSWDPAIALAPNGTVYVAFMLGLPSGDVPAVAWSWDHGATFSGSALAGTPSLSEFSDRDFVAVAPNGTVDLTWDYSPNASLDSLGCASGGSCYFVTGDYNVVSVHSSDGGRTWSAPVPIDPEYPSGGAVAAPLVVAPNGTIDVLYEDYAVSGSAHTLGAGYNYFSRSFDGGTTWTAPVRVANLSFAPTVWWIDGDLALDGGGTLYASFDSTAGSNDTAWVAASSDGGATWGTPIRVNPDHDTAVHVLVGVAGGAAGTAYVAWMANNSTSGWATFEAALSLAPNGTSWGAVAQVSAAYGVPGYWIGDTLGLSWLGGNATAVSWSYGVTLNGSTRSEVYAAVVGVAPPGPPSLLRPVPGAARVSVAWTPPASGPAPSGYVVSWAIEGNPVGNLTVLAPAGAATVTGLFAGARYSFWVRAFDAGGLGPPSRTANVTLTAWEVVTGTLEPATATVTIDSRPVATAAGAFAINTTATAHLLLVQATDYLPDELALGTAWNGTVWANVTLGLLGGTARGTIFPALSSATWDGLPLPLADGSFTVSAAGNTTHLLAASYPGFAPQGESVRVPPNATAWFNLSLTPLHAHLDLVLVPANASLWVNGSAAEAAPGGYANLSLPASTYPIEVAAAGFSPYFTNVTLLPGEWRNLTVALTPLATVPPPSPAPGASDPLSALVGNPAGLLGLLVAAGVVGLLLLWAARRRRRPPGAAAGEAPVEPFPEAEPPALPDGTT